MAQLLPNGRQQFLDANGNPLVGGLVYFYIPNTTTPKDTWQDSAKSALNTNPVVCDARGQATIYGDGDYRQILQDAQNNQIWDKDVSAPVPPYVFDQGSEPTTDQGDIWINGIGPCRWDSTDSRYYRIPYTVKLVITSSQTITLDAYTPKIRVNGCAGGGGGGSGGGGGNSFLGAGGGGGGAGQSCIDTEITVTPGQSIDITIGAGGTGAPADTSGHGSGSKGGDGGNTTLGSLLTLTGGSGGSGGITANNITVTGGARGAGWPSGGDGMDGNNATAPANVGASCGGCGGSSPFGGGGGLGAGRNSSGDSGSDAGNYGGGGGGGGGYAYGTTPGNGGAGGNGADGFMIVEY